MTDRLNEIKERLAKAINVSELCTRPAFDGKKVWFNEHYSREFSSTHHADLIAHCPDDIAWLIAELEKERAKNNCPTCNFFRKDHDCGKQIETVTEFRCGTETVYKDGTKDFEWSPCGFCGRSQCDC